MPTTATIDTATMKPDGQQRAVAEIAEGRVGETDTHKGVPLGSD
jgi:hypothetical protein